MLTLYYQSGAAHERHGGKIFLDGNTKSWSPITRAVEIEAADPKAEWELFDIGL